jgi:hypothetical protein|tara:strand:- start:915 stop:1229 length:315 start_codon:yes stop_codon:yes gene_type:complete
MNSLGKPTPSIFTMVKTFASEIKTYIANGSPNVSTEDYIERLGACNTCEHLKKPIMRCGLCGCLLEHKAKWKTTTCPDKPTRWKKQILDGVGQESNSANNSNKA